MIADYLCLAFLAHLCCSIFVNLIVIGIGNEKNEGVKKGTQINVDTNLKGTNRSYVRTVFNGGRGYRVDV
jgi:hypothetical protein